MVGAAENARDALQKLLFAGIHTETSTYMLMLFLPFDTTLTLYDGLWQAKIPYICSVTWCTAVASSFAAAA